MEYQQMDSTTVQSEKTRCSRRETELAVAERALDLWLCWHAAGPHEVIPYILKTLADGAVSDEMVEAISKRASKWTQSEHTYNAAHDPEVIVRLANRGARKK
jgi:hypothetical protein